jgi:hypothetical protein
MHGGRIALFERQILSGRETEERILRDSRHCGPHPGAQRRNSLLLDDNLETRQITNVLRIPRSWNYDRGVYQIQPWKLYMYCNEDYVLRKTIDRWS